MKKQLELASITLCDRFDGRQEIPREDWDVPGLPLRDSAKYILGVDGGDEIWAHIAPRAGESYLSMLMSGAPAGVLIPDHDELILWIEAQRWA